MPENRPEQEPPQEELHTAIPPESADEQSQEDPKGHGGRTFLEHAKESMEEHAKLGMLLAESERQCRDSLERGLPEDLRPSRPGG